MALLAHRYPSAKPSQAAPLLRQVRDFALASCCHVSTRTHANSLLAFVTWLLPALCFSCVLSYQTSVAHRLLRAPQAQAAKPPPHESENPLLALVARLLPPAADLEVAPVVKILTDARPLLLPWTLAHVFDLLTPFGRDAGILQVRASSAHLPIARACFAYVGVLARLQSKCWRHDSDALWV